jgi:hypothetical protein
MYPKKQTVARPRNTYVLVFWAVVSIALIHHALSEEAEIRVVTRADDIGSCHAANLACIQCYQEGIIRTVEIMVPAPWFNEAVKMLKENPGLDVGAHLTLTSEWEYCKWRPLTSVPSLVDKQGCFYPMTSQRSDFPPNTGFLQSGFKSEEVERELRAQIELAKQAIPSVTHLTVHMGTATCTPELRALVKRLSEEYKLPLELPPIVKRTPNFSGSSKSAQQKEADLVKILENLTPGTWHIIEHPGLDMPEMRALGHIGYRNVAEDRAGVTSAFTSPKVKEAIKRRGIILTSYGQLYK